MWPENLNIVYFHPEIVYNPGSIREVESLCISAWKELQFNTFSQALFYDGVGLQKHHFKGHAI